DQTPTGPVDRCARYTPDQEGPYLVSDEKGNVVDEFICTPSEHSGYVMVSGKDSRYFACSDGSSYVPIGLNLVGCGYDRQPAGHEHFRASEALRTTGMIQWQRWLSELHASGANYVRIWLSNRYTEARTEIMGVHDLAAFARLDRIMDFLQVHRYLDQGAPLAICHADPVAFSLDAVRRCSTGTKPLILTETGAVNDRHVGPFRFYPADHGGLIFDDVTYPPFFCGAAAF
ncbi:MAG: hypothetical protein PHX55_07110, partial [Eubacteriales bacterium]|nr:hypothetical protein [Eubacteriales bacterium]